VFATVAAGEPKKNDWSSLLVAIFPFCLESMMAREQQLDATTSFRGRSARKKNRGARRRSQSSGSACACIFLQAA